MKTQKISFVFIFIITSAFIISCATVKHRNAGDKYYVSGEYIKAVDEYKKALELNPKLNSNLKFQTKYELALTTYHYQLGLDFKSIKAWDKAISEFEQVLEIDSKNTSAKKHLNESYIKSSEYHYNNGLKCADNGELDDAIEEFEYSIKLNAENTAAKEALEIALRTKKEQKRKAEEHYNIALNFSNQKKFYESVNEFNECLKYDPNHVLARSKKKEANDYIDQTEKYFQSGMKYFERKDWGKAISAFNNAINVYPDNSKAKVKIDQAKEQIRLSESYLDKGNINFDQKKWDEAIKEYREALNTNPAYNAASLKLNIALNEGAKKHCLLGNNYLKENNLKDANKEFELALNYIPGLDSAKTGLAKVCYRQGQNYFIQGKKANALIEFKKSNTLMTGFKDCCEKINSIEREIKERISYRIAMLPFRNYTDEKRLNDIISDKVISNLMSNKMKNISFIERNYLEKILREQDLSLSGLIDPNTEVPVGKIQGVDAIITGKVLSYKITTSSNNEARSQSYQSGQREEYNYEYDQMAQKVENARSELERENYKYQQDLNRYEKEMQDYNVAYSNYQYELNNCTQQINNIENQIQSIDNTISSLYRNPPVDQNQVQNLQNQKNQLYNEKSQWYSRKMQLQSFGAAPQKPLQPWIFGVQAAESNLKNAQDNLVRTQQYYYVPVYDNWDYQVIHYNKEVKLIVSCRVIDVVTGKVLYSESIQKVDREQDDVIDRPNNMAGVYSDPLALESDSKMTDDVIYNLVNDLEKNIKKSLEKYGDRYLILASKEVNKGNFEGAIEEYVNFIYANDNNKSQDQSEAKNFIKKYKNFNWQ